MATAVSAGRIGTRASEHTFFTSMALVVLASVVVGFAPSYYLRGILPPAHPYEPLTPLVWLHGLVFSAWILLFVVQTRLAGSGRTDLHRRLGRLGFIFIVAMLPLGVLAGIGGISRPLTAAPGVDPLSWSALPILDAPLLCGLIGMALYKRREPAAHKRFMLAAMLDMLQPALGRALPYFGAQGPLVLFAPVPFLLVLPAWDLYARGRLHYATMWGIGLVMLRLVVTPMIWSTTSWMHFAQWTTTLLG